VGGNVPTKWLAIKAITMRSTRWSRRWSSHHGRVDILVNNAGGTVPAPHAEDIPALVSRLQGTPRSDDDFERTVLFHAFAVQMKPDQSVVVRHPRIPTDARPGRHRFASSMSPAARAIPRGSPTLVSYGAAKSGLNHLTRSLAEEWGPAARVNCVALGPTITDNFRSFVLPKDDPTGSTYFDALPLKRGGEPGRGSAARVSSLASGGSRFHQRNDHRNRRRHAAGRALRGRP